MTREGAADDGESAAKFLGNDSFTKEVFGKLTDDPIRASIIVIMHSLQLTSMMVAGVHTLHEKGSVVLPNPKAARAWTPVEMQVACAEMARRLGVLKQLLLTRLRDAEAAVQKAGQEAFRSNNAEWALLKLKEARAKLRAEEAVDSTYMEKARGIVMSTFARVGKETMLDLQKGDEGALTKATQAILEVQEVTCKCDAAAMLARCSPASAPMTKTRIKTTLAHIAVHALGEDAMGREDFGGLLKIVVPRVVSGRKNGGLKLADAGAAVKQILGIISRNPEVVGKMMKLAPMVMAVLESVNLEANPHFVKTFGKKNIGRIKGMMRAASGWVKRTAGESALTSDEVEDACSTMERLTSKIEETGGDRMLTTSAVAGAVASAQNQEMALGMLERVAASEKGE